jgi:hypothetical protein
MLFHLPEEVFVSIFVSQYDKIVIRGGFDSHALPPVNKAKRKEYGTRYNNMKKRGVCLCCFK